MKERRLGNVTLFYSAESEPVAEGILKFAAQCNERLAQWFKPDAAVPQTVYWMSRKNWRSKPENYGFPYASGPNAYLAAADVDLPTQLALIADSMDIEKGGPDIERMAQRLGLPKGSKPAEVHRHLKESKEFFVIFTAYFILPHELTHGYCNALGYPPQPRWLYEGMAQWAAYRLHGELRLPAEAEMIYAYYQLLWDRGAGNLRVTSFAQADELGAGKLDTPNYAWYHAGLLRMFRELEEMKGANPLPELIRVLGQKHRGQRRVPHDEMVKTVSEVIGRDLQTWLADTWQLGR
jgi:hypothetical protein